MDVVTHRAPMRLFYQLLGNTLLASINNMTVWFGLIFFVFLETRSVFATAILSGIYLVTVAVSGFWFGSLVDRHRKKTVMLLSSAVSLACYGVGLAVYLLAAADAFARPGSVTLWVLVVVLLAGVIVGNLRGIALPTLVTIIIPEDRRDRANGLVGTASGISFLIVSVISGLLIARFGLGRRPLRALFGANLIIWAVCSVMTIQSSLILLLVGMFIYLCVVPAIEAAEQTIIQKVVPHERQGRVFGFAQSMEMAASPLTAFLIGPIAQFIFIPFMTTGAGVELIGGWFGTGPDRGIALVFTITGLIGLAMTLISMRSPAYRRLATRYRAEEPPAPDHAERAVAPDLPVA